MGLDHRRISIDIDDQPGQEITLAMNKAVGIIIRTDEAERLAYAVGRSDSSGPEISRQGLDTKQQNTHRNRAHLPMAHTEYIALGGAHLDQVTLAGGIVGIVGIERDTRYSTREDPGMEAEERLLLMGTENDLGHGG